VENAATEEYNTIASIKRQLTYLQETVDAQGLLLATLKADVAKLVAALPQPVVGIVVEPGTPTDR
jgi:hypothetical protein